VKMRIWQKLLVSTLALAVPLAVGGALLLRVEMRSVESGQRGAAGVVMYQGIEELLVQVADHGGTLGAVLAGDASLKPKVAEILKAADEHAAEFADGNAKYGELFGTRAQADAVLAKWRDLAANSPKMTVEQSAAAHNALLGELLRLNDAVADGSGLSNYADLGAWHFATAAALVPVMERSMADLRSTAMAAAASRAVTPEQAGVLNARIADDERLYGEIRRNLEAGAKLSAGGDALRAIYGPKVEEFGQGLEAFHALIRGEVLGARTVTIGAENVFATGSRTYDALGEVHDVIIPTLEKVFAAQVSAARRNAILLVGLFALALGLGLAAMLLVSRRLSRSLRQAVAVFGQIEQGRYDTKIVVDSSDEAGQVLSSLDRMQHTLSESLERERAVAASNERIRIALDKVSTNVMVADADGKIIYMNEAVHAMFRGQAAEIRKQLPAFDPDRILDHSFDQFHRNPAHQRNMLSTLTSLHSADMKLGEASLRVLASPVIDNAGHRLGTVVQWLDRTLEVATEEEIQFVVKQALEGDLTRRIRSEGKTGFFLALADGINGLVDNMAGVIRTIKSSTREVANGADEISKGNLNLSQRTEEQASSLEETASSMEEMTSTVRQNADNAAQANQLAQAARQQAEKGGSVVGQAVAAMSEINTSSKRIADIIGVIDEIAFQTNLLALNAAVEAARAGEQGRGFAVVASEVRNLASRSAEAAKEIKALIQDSVGKVTEGSKLVDQSGQTLSEIVASVKKVTDIVAEIAAASQEQSAGIEQVNKAVTSMDEVTQQNAALVEEAAAAAEALMQQSQSLMELMQKYRTGEEESNVVWSGHDRREVDVWRNPPRERPEPKAPPARRPVVRRPAAKSAAPATAARAPAKAAGSGEDWNEF
jgi:methyl-accepting chemotaxis protein